MQLMVTRFETEKDVYSYKKWFVAPGPDTVVNVEIRFESVSFLRLGDMGFHFALMARK